MKAGRKDQRSYLWRGHDRQGRKLSGEQTGSSRMEIRAQLRCQGITPDRISRKASLSSWRSDRKISPVIIAVFTRQLATMVRAGIPLAQAFDLAGETLDNEAMKLLTGRIREELAAGRTLAESLRQHPSQFDALFCNLVEAGEQSGTLDVMLERLACHKEKMGALRSRVRKALKYPLAVLFIAFVVTAVLLISVVPQFADTFASFGAELPRFTQLVITLSDTAASHWGRVLTGAAIGYAIVRKLHSSSRSFADLCARTLLRLPMIGALLAKSCHARVARTLATSTGAGVPLIEALNGAAGASGHVIYYNACQQVKLRVSDGLSLAAAMRGTGKFPLLLSQMVAVGEQSGTLEQMLDKCASHYETEVDNGVEGLTSLLEPIIMSVLGVVTGGLMIAMYLPVFQLGAIL